MNQAKLITKLAETGASTRRKTGQAVEGVLATISNSLKAGEKVVCRD